MPKPDVRRFDLNIEKILEGWEIPHALREIVANALDEQALTDTRDVEIAKDAQGRWHVRDYGRGLKYEHLTQNENGEKLKNAEKVVGKFGVGLKDALATLHRRGVDVAIQSKHGNIALDVVPKHGFADIETLHAAISPAADKKFIGTDFVFRRLVDSDIADAKRFFLCFSGDEVLETTGLGQILRRREQARARIYVKGLLVAEEDEFAFSYNITSLTAAMNRALNRERSNVGRTAYSDRVKAMLLASSASEVAETLAADLQRMELGTSHDEVKWTDVAVHACQILNAAKKVVFVTAQQRTLASDAIDHAIADGYEAVTVPDNIRQRLRGIKDMNGNAVRDLDTYAEEFSRSFEFTFIDIGKLSTTERKVFDLREAIAKLGGGLPRQVKDIKVSETMRPAFISASDALGLWEPHKGRIIIKRSELLSVEAFAGTLLHEIAHARSGYGDVSREFEGELTALIGKISARALKKY